MIPEDQENKTECYVLFMWCHYCVSGPGTYNPLVRDKHGNMIVTKDKRFRESLKSDVPGPGAYEVSTHCDRVGENVFLAVCLQVVCWIGVL